MIGLLYYSYLFYFHKRSKNVPLFLAVNWLDHNKTLREQSIDVNETLLLRRKYFFSDQNVDARDPVQLNLLYVQVSISFVQIWLLFHVPVYLL